jgi:hypothetical protein
LKPGDRILFAAVQVWALVAHPGVWRRSLRNKVGIIPNPALPASDTDKFLWRKIFDHNPLFSMCCDKLAAKDYALDRVPGLKTAEVLWQGNDPTQIPAELLTGNVVVKGNHGSRWNILVRNGALDREKMIRRASQWMTTLYNRSAGEWAYRGARPLILVERMLQEPDGRPVATEYKFHTSAGRIAYIYVKRHNADGTDNWYTYDREGTPLPVGPGRTAWLAFPLPETFVRMRDAAEELGSAFDHIRVDFYSLGDDIYFPGSPPAAMPVGTCAGAGS